MRKGFEDLVILYCVQVVVVLISVVFVLRSLALHGLDRMPP